MSIMEKVNAMAKNVSEKATDAMETTRLNTKISEENKKIFDLHKVIGGVIWNKFEMGEEVPYEVKEFCERIKESQEIIEESTMEIQKIKEDQGDEVEKSQVEVPKILCPACGLENNEGTKFCGECGAKLQ